MHKTVCRGAKSCRDISLSCLEICGQQTSPIQPPATTLFTKSSPGKVGEDVGKRFRQSYWIPNPTAVRGQDRALKTPAEPDDPFIFLCPYPSPERIPETARTCCDKADWDCGVFCSTAQPEKEGPGGYNLLASWEWQRRGPGTRGGGRGTQGRKPSRG